MNDECRAWLGLITISARLRFCGSHREYQSQACYHQPPSIRPEPIYMESWAVLSCAVLTFPLPTLSKLFNISREFEFQLCGRCVRGPGPARPGEENKLFFGLRAAIKNNRNELLFQFHEYLKINDLDIFCRSQKLMNMQLVSSQRATNRVTPNNRPHLANKLQLQ